MINLCNGMKTTPMYLGIMCAKFRALLKPPYITEQSIVLRGLRGALN